MMSLTMLGMTLDPLVPTLFLVYIFIFTIPLVELVAWGLAFFYRQESSPNVIFSHLLYSHQYEMNPKVVNSSKCFGAQIPCSFYKFETRFYSYSLGLTSPH